VGEWVGDFHVGYKCARECVREFALRLGRWVKRSMSGWLMFASKSPGTTCSPSREKMCVCVCERESVCMCVSMQFSWLTSSLSTGKEEVSQE